METIIVSLICVALMVIGGMTMSQGFLSSVDSSSMGWEEMGQRDEDIMRTAVSTANATLTAATYLEVTLCNDGQTKLGDFVQWDVIVQHYTASGKQYVTWLPYTTSASPGDNEWTVKGIYLDANAGTPEVFEPNIFNPGEEMIVYAKISPPAGPNTTNLATVSTPNGISASIIFVR